MDQTAISNPERKKTNSFNIERILLKGAKTLLSKINYLLRVLLFHLIRKWDDNMDITSFLQSVLLL